MSKAKKTDGAPRGKKRKYVVSIAVDCRVDKVVEAESFEEAFDIAVAEGFDRDEWKKVEIINDIPVNATDTVTGELRDY